MIALTGLAVPEVPGSFRKGVQSSMKRMSYCD
jgi:hypothetical protein